ncbi:MAG: signal peptidase I [Caldisericia bacterium]|nr:signal peptidase I [Caldisericia bacterium]
MVFTKDILGNYDIIINLFRFVIICAYFYLTFFMPIVVGILFLISSILGLSDMNALTTIEMVVLSIRLITGCLLIVLPLLFKSKTTQNDQGSLVTNENPQKDLPTKIECPICHNSDSVLLLSTAYLQSLPLSEKGIPDITKSNENNISTIMAPPKEPRKYIHVWWFLSGAVFVYLLTMSISNFFHQPSSEPFFSVLGFLFGYIFWINLSFSNGILLSQVNQYTDKNIAPLYQKALHFWNGLYYCEEDNLVFDPVSDKSTDTENLRTFIVTETGYNDALYQSLRMKPEKQTGKKKGISPLGLVGLVALFMIHIFLTTYLIGTFASPVLFRDRSMNPTIKKHSFILNTRLNYFAKNPKRGDIIVFHQTVEGEDTYFMQRVIALPGETVGWKNGEIRIDDKKLDEPYLFGKLKNNEMEINGFDDMFLKKDEFFVMGDDRSISTDSRSFGPVQRDNILGKVYFFVNFSKE